MNIKVGQKVFVIGLYRKSVDEPIVTKISRKYFQLEGYYSTQFSIETGKDKNGQYSSQYQVYESKEAYEQELERKALAEKLQKFVNSNLKYETLLAIQKLIEDDK
jgi:hypothetical protein